MASKNNITGDSIISKVNTKSYSDNYDLIFPDKLEIIFDAVGTMWEKCGKRCFMECDNGIIKCDKKGCTNVK